MEADEKKAVVSKYLKALNSRDLSTIRQIYAPDATVEDPVGSDVHVGIDAICAFFQGAMDMGLCLDEPPEYVRCAGDSAAFPLAGNVNGMRVRAIDVFQFNDAGKIQSMRAYFGQDDLTPQ